MSGCRNLRGVPNVKDDLRENAPWEGRSEATDRLMERSWVRLRSVGADAAIWGMLLTVMERS